MNVYDYKLRKDAIADHIVDCIKILYDNSYPCVENGSNYEDIMVDVLHYQLQNKNKEDPIELEGTDGKKYLFPYDFYYCPVSWQTMVVDNFMDAYGITRTWEDNVDVLTDYVLNEDGGHVKDAWIKDDDGRGHRGYEKLNPLKTEILNIINKNINDNILASTLSDEIIDKFNEYISYCREFYRFGLIEENQFRGGVVFRSPTTNRETVINAWKAVFNKDIEIPNDDNWTDEFDERLYEDDENDGIDLSDDKIINDD